MEFFEEPEDALGAGFFEPRAREGGEIVEVWSRGDGTKD